MAQLADVANMDPLTITTKNIDSDLTVINVDLLERQARDALTEGIYVFIAHGSGKMWTLRKKTRAFNDWVFTPHRVGVVVRKNIDTTVNLLGETLPHPIIISLHGQPRPRPPCGRGCNCTRRRPVGCAA